MPKWHHPDISSGDVKESITTKILKVYPTSRSGAILLLYGLDWTISLVVIIPRDVCYGNYVLKYFKVLSYGVTAVQTNIICKKPGKL